MWPPIETYYTPSKIELHLTLILILVLSLCVPLGGVVFGFSAVVLSGGPPPPSAEINLRICIRDTNETGPLGINENDSKKEYKFCDPKEGWIPLKSLCSHMMLGDNWTSGYVGKIAEQCAKR
jgi:hypothetical protein